MSEDVTLKVRYLDPKFQQLAIHYLRREDAQALFRFAGFLEDLRVIVVQEFPPKRWWMSLGVEKTARIIVDKGLGYAGHIARETANALEMTPHEPTQGDDT